MKQLSVPLAGSKPREAAIKPADRDSLPAKPPDTLLPGAGAARRHAGHHALCRRFLTVALLFHVSPPGPSPRSRPVLLFQSHTPETCPGKSLSDLIQAGVLDSGGQWRALRNPRAAA